jgi:hypothetical protein
MKKGKMEARKIFESIVRSQERFDLDFAMNAAEQSGAFDDYSEMTAVKRDKKAIARNMIVRIMGTEGERDIRSYEADGCRVFVNIPITHDKDALKYFEDRIKNAIQKKARSFKHIRNLRYELEGQITLDEISTSPSGQIDVAKVDVKRALENAGGL